MSDPHAAAKESNGVATAAALALIYQSVRSNVTERVGLGSRSDLVLPRWPGRVRETLTYHAKRTAATVAAKDAPDMQLGRMDAMLEAIGRAHANTWHDRLNAALAEIDAGAQDLMAEVAATLDRELGPGAVELDAQSIVHQSANFAASEAAAATSKKTKTWHTSDDDDTRATHAAQNGLTIPIDGRFPNGLRYPKSPGPPREVVNCLCYLTFGG